MCYTSEVGRMLGSYGAVFLVGAAFGFAWSFLRDLWRRRRVAQVGEGWRLPEDRLVGKFHISLGQVTAVGRVLRGSEDDPLYPESSRFLFWAEPSVSSQVAERQLFEWNLLCPERAPIPLAIVLVPPPPTPIRKVVISTDPSSQYCMVTVLYEDNGVVFITANLSSRHTSVERLTDNNETVGFDLVSSSPRSDLQIYFLLMNRGDSVKLFRIEQNTEDPSRRQIAGFSTVIVPNFDNEHTKLGLNMGSGRCLIFLESSSRFLLLAENGHLELLDPSLVPRHLLPLLKPGLMAHASWTEGPRRVFHLKKSPDGKEVQVWERRVQPTTLEAQALQTLLQTRPELKTLQQRELRAFGIPSAIAATIVNGKQPSEPLNIDLRTIHV